jgi:hypothetical protein
MAISWPSYIAHKSLAFEVLVVLNVLRCVFENEPYMMPTMIAGGKALAKYACNFMLLRMVRIVHNFVNPGMRNLISRLEFITNVSHISS